METTKWFLKTISKQSVREELEQQENISKRYSMETQTQFSWKRYYKFINEKLRATQAHIQIKGKNHNILLG